MDKFIVMRLLEKILNKNNYSDNRAGYLNKINSFSFTINEKDKTLEKKSKIK